MKEKENEFLKKYSNLSLDELNESFKISGLSDSEVLESRLRYGKNKVDNSDSILGRLKRAFINPYSIVLLSLGIISLFTDVILASKKSYSTIIIVFSMLIVAGTIRLIEELKAKRIADRLNEFSDFKVSVRRNEQEEIIDASEIVVGDLIILKAGERVPCDIRIVKASKAYVSESSITGESEMIQKSTRSKGNLDNILLSGTALTSGIAEGYAIAVGKARFNEINTYPKDKRGYDQGTNSIIWVLIKFMIVLVPLIFVTVGLLKDNWIEALLFSLSVAVGLTPELLPMVITA